MYMYNKEKRHKHRAASPAAASYLSVDAETLAALTSFMSSVTSIVSNAALHQTTAKLQRREFCNTLGLKIDQRVNNAPQYVILFLIKIQDKTADTL